MLRDGLDADANERLDDALDAEPVQPRVLTPAETADLLRSWGGDVQMIEVA